MTRPATASPDQLSRLRTLAAGADASEQSWSISAAGVEARKLFFFDAAGGRAADLATVARDLGMPAALIEAWLAALPGADAVMLGLSRDLRSVRLYTQYWDAQVKRVRAGDQTPFPLYAGFKALGDGTVRRDIYQCLPMAPPEVFMPEITAMAEGLGLDTAMARDVFAPLNGSNTILTATASDKRRSWLLTVRRAEIAATALARWLAPLETRPDARAVVAQARTRRLMHVAGGRDTAKGVFATFYFEADPRAGAAALIPARRRPDN